MPCFQPSGHCLVLGVSSADTVDAVARRADALCGGTLTRHSATLVYGGKRLRGDRSLSDYDVRAGDSLALVPRARRDAAAGLRGADGGGSPPPAVPGREGAPPASPPPAGGELLWHC